MYAFVSVVQSLWVHQMRDVHIGFRPGSTRNYAAYMPPTKTIWLSTAPLSAWALLSELAHAMDDALWDPPGFASQHGGNPLASFAEILRPYYAAAAKERARTLSDQMMRIALHPDVVQELQGGGVALEDIVRGMSVPPALQDVLGDLLSTVDLENATQRAEARQILRLDQGRGRGEMWMLRAIQRSIRDTSRGPVVDGAALRAALVELEEAYLLAPHELFSRYFSQYVRMYWAQMGLGFGPQTLPGDIDPHHVAELSETFNDALLRAQELDYKGLDKKAASSMWQQQAVAALLSLVGIGYSERLIRS